MVGLGPVTRESEEAGEHLTTSQTTVNLAITLWQPAETTTPGTKASPKPGNSPKTVSR